MESILIKNHFKDKKIVNVKKVGFVPENCYEKPPYFLVYAYAIPIVFAVVQLPALAYNLFYLWNEKNNQLVKYMSIINVDSLTYFLKNRLIDFILTLISYIPVLVIIKYGQIIVYTNFLYLFVYMIVFLISTNTLFMFCASFFKDSSIAMVVGFLVFLIGSLLSIRVKMDIFIPQTIIHKILVSNNNKRIF